MPGLMAAACATAMGLGTGNGLTPFGFNHIVDGFKYSLQIVAAAAWTKNLTVFTLCNGGLDIKGFPAFLTAQIIERHGTCHLNRIS